VANARHDIGVVKENDMKNIKGEPTLNAKQEAAQTTKPSMGAAMLRLMTSEEVLQVSGGRSGPSNRGAGH
jgi:hypothetical protein